MVIVTGPDWRAYRFKRGLRQADLAEALGVSRYAVVQMEADRIPPSRTILLALAAYEAGLAPFSFDPDEKASFKRTPLRVDVEV